MEQLRNRNRPTDRLICFGVAVWYLSGELCRPLWGSSAPSTIQVGLGPGVGEITVRPVNFTGVTRLGPNDLRLDIALAAFRSIK